MSTSVTSNTTPDIAQLQAQVNTLQQEVTELKSEKSGWRGRTADKLDNLQANNPSKLHAMAAGMGALFGLKIGAAKSLSVSSLAVMKKMSENGDMKAAMRDVKDPMSMGVKISEAVAKAHWDGLRNMGSSPYGKIMGATLVATAAFTGIGYVAGGRVSQLEHAGDLVRHPLDAMGEMFLGTKPKTQASTLNDNATVPDAAPSTQIDTQTLMVAQPLHHHTILAHR